MNAIKILKLLNKSSKLCRRNKQVMKSLQPLSYSNVSTRTSKLPTQGEKDRFQDVLPGIIDMLVTNPKLRECPEVTSWIKKVLDYNLTGGKKVRGLATVFAYEMLEKPENITEESLQVARILGWCVEMLQAYFLVIDDIMDEATTRRGVSCWYKLPDVGMGALNDSIIILSSMFQTLEKHFGNHPHYAEILNQFNNTLLYTSVGQHLDYTMAHHHKDDYALFTAKTYQAITKYKTAYYTYSLPVHLGLLLADIVDKEIHKKAEVICLEIGNFFQIQDDYIDCFGEEGLTGKVGSDIQEGKCTWLAVEALQRCSEAQRRVFTACYGSREPAHVARVRRLYDELQLPQLYRQQQDEIRENIVREVRKLPATLAPDLFLRLVDIIYERKQ